MFLVSDVVDVYEQLKSLLYSDSAVAGEAAGIAMGLTMIGSNNEAALTDMMTYAHETQHEKIIRGMFVPLFRCLRG